MASSDDVDWDRVNHIHAVGSTPVHRREQDRLNGELPACEVGVADRATLTAVALGPIAGRLWLPEPERASPIEGPDGSWQGWEWPDGSDLLLQADRDGRLPMIGALTVGGASARRATLAGAVMRVRRSVAGDGIYLGPGFAADVEGILGAATRFWAQIAAPTAERRDLLLAALFTLDVPDGAEARWGPNPDGTFGPRPPGA